MYFSLTSFSQRSPFALTLLLLLASGVQLAGVRDAIAQSDMRRLPTPGGQSPRAPSRFPRRSSAPATTGNSTVNGRVVYKDNLKPLKGAQVHVFPANSNSTDVDSIGPGIVAFTNNSGEFQVANLAAGKYYVTVGGAGLSSPSGLGVRLPIPISAIPRREEFEEIVPPHDAQFTVDGNNSAQLEVAILRGGSISGMVLQPNRAPVSHVAVNIISREGSAGAGMVQFSTQTDRHGEYRLENVPPGEYVVAAAIDDSKANVDIRARMRGEAQVVTYHPAATTSRNAMAVRVQSGLETANVNVTLVARNKFTVSGTVIRQQDGTPVAGATVLLRNQDSDTGGMIAPGLGQRSTRSDSSGNWTFSGVQEGMYVATALVPSISSRGLARMPGGPTELGGADGGRTLREERPRFLIAHHEVLVAGADLTQLSLMIVGPGSIRGNVSPEDGALPSDFVIFLEMTREGGRPERPLPVRVKPDGSFSVKDIQGGYSYLNVALMPGSSYVLKSITANGADPRQSALNVIEGAETGPIQIVITTRSAQLTGRVVSQKNNEGLSDYVVLLAPVQKEQQRFRTAYLNGRTSSDGSFQITGEPGDYLVWARQRGNLPAVITEDFVKAEGPRAVRVTLKAGEPNRLDLKVP